MLATALAAICALTVPAAAQNPRGDPPAELFVDPGRGSDKAAGDARHPLKSIAAALARVPDPVEASVTIRLVPGTYATTGGVGMPENALHLMRRTRPGVVVRLVVVAGEQPVLLDWASDELVVATEGEWQLDGVRIGSFTTQQRRGVTVVGPARVELKNVAFRLRSLSDAAIWARDGGTATLRGRIAVNEHLHDAADDETFSGLIATEHGIIRFAEREGASLDLGNGTLSVRTYGMIRLGCEKARITSWTQSNNLAVNDGGRIDVMNTAVTLCAKKQNNTPIGLEHDGHVLAEDAVITITGKNDSAIALQKASTFTCNDIVLDGEFANAIWASSGSMFCGRFKTAIGGVRASTGAGIHVEKVEGEVRGPVEARSGGVVSLPDRVVRSE